MAKHEKEHDLEALHKEGACLTRHKERSKSLCSHQDQARIQGETDDKAVYKYPAYKSLIDKGTKTWATRQRLTGSGNLFPEGYGERRKIPKPGEWDPGPGDHGNFEHFLRPWWHNAHHIVPNGSLNTAIVDAAKSDARLDNLIRAGLLAAEYNLNDKVNMINLPMESVIGKTYGLPRHLRGDEVPDDVKAEFFSHTDYNKCIEGRLKSIMNDYKAALADALKDHPPSPQKLSKDKLVKLSEDTRKMIFTAGTYNGGMAISDIVF